MQFTGGKDDRKSPEDESRPPFALEGTYSNASLEINDDSTWKLEEGGGHQYAHSRASNKVKAEGTWKINGDKYLFTVSKYENQNSDARGESTSGTGKTFERSVADVKAGKFKSFFFDIDLSPA